jgi:hypothetical protein
MRGFEKMLTQIEAQGHRALLKSPNEQPNVIGDGNVDYRCPNCGHLIIRGWTS